MGLKSLCQTVENAISNLPSVTEFRITISTEPLYSKRQIENIRFHVGTLNCHSRDLEEGSPHGGHWRIDVKQHFEYDLAKAEENHVLDFEWGKWAYDRLKDKIRTYDWNEG